MLSRLAVQPRAQWHSELGTHRFCLLPHTRILLRQPRAVPFRHLLPAFPLLLAFAIVLRALSQPQTVSPALGVGDIDIHLDFTHDHTGAVRN